MKKLVTFFGTRSSKLLFRSPTSNWIKSSEFKFLIYDNLVHISKRGWMSFHTFVKRKEHCFWICEYRSISLARYIHFKESRFKIFSCGNNRPFPLRVLWYGTIHLVAAGSRCLHLARIVVKIDYTLVLINTNISCSRVGTSSDKYIPKFFFWYKRLIYWFFMRRCLLPNCIQVMKMVMPPTKLFVIHLKKDSILYPVSKMDCDVTAPSGGAPTQSFQIIPMSQSRMHFLKLELK